VIFGVAVREAGKEPNAMRSGVKVFAWRRIL
jgi:hypothetical protein